MARYVETAWSLSGQHTGLTDLPLTERGKRNARALGERLNGLGFVKVFTSRSSVEIHAERPDWQLFRDGCPDGESPLH
jgi:probable phosphoglycerate mutase